MALERAGYGKGAAERNMDRRRRAGSPGPS
jgi:hypothetical protein